jgi:Zn-finger nucleic acid-binding protein
MAASARQRGREFLLQYRDLYSIIYWEFPDFWRDRGELERLLAREEARSTQDVGVQVVWGGCQQWDRSTQTEPLPGLEPLPERQPASARADERSAPPPKLRDAARPKQERKQEPRGPTSRGSTQEEPPYYPASPAGCWNCGSRVHKYSRCPRNRERVFCYACGYVGVSIKDCPRCGDEWTRAAARRGSKK